MTRTLAKDFDAASSTSATSVGAPLSGVKTTRHHVLSGLDDDMVSLCIQLRSLQAERLMLKCARDNLESVASLTPTKDEEIQRRFDALTDKAVDLAERAATQKARTLAELSAKAAFVLELAEPNDDGPLERLLWGLAVDVIAYSAENSLDCRAVARDG